MPEPADPDHDGEGPRPEHGPRPLDGGVRREPGVGERRRLDRVEVTQRDEVARVRHDHQRRHAAVGSDARRRRAGSEGALAVALEPTHAPRAAATAPRPVDRDRLADLDGADAFAHGGDPARVLVPERERHRPRQCRGVHLEEVHVGVARTGAGDAQQHLARPRLGFRHLAELRFVRAGDELECEHRKRRERRVAAQSIGTLRTILPSMRAKISSRLWPVIVSPWLRWPTTARDGSGAWRTSSATDSASSTVPHG